MGGMQGVQGLREEMSDLLLRSEKMREEHSSLLRLSQVTEIYLYLDCVILFLIESIVMRDIFCYVVKSGK